MNKDLYRQVDEIAEQSRHDHLRKRITRIVSLGVTTYLVGYTLVRILMLTGEDQVIISMFH